MQADNTLPIDERRNYKHVGDAFVRITREEGVFALWKGCSPTIVRAMALNLGMLAPFDYCKEIFASKWGAGKKANLAASAVSGFFASFLSLPFDYMKTKIQKQKPLLDGSLPYTGIMDAFRKTIAREGVTGLWTGYPTYYMRIAPHAMLVLLIADFMRSVINK
jgi:solute carrier family 25 oxoglutarate transporter 11